MQIEVPIAELRKKRIFVATPMYGGMCAGSYTKSSTDLSSASTKQPSTTAFLRYPVNSGAFNLVQGD